MELAVEWTGTNSPLCIHLTHFVQIILKKQRIRNIICVRDALWLCICIIWLHMDVIMFSHCKVFTYTDGSSMFKTYAIWKIRRNGERRDRDKGVKEIKEKMNRSEGRRYQRCDTLLNFNAVFHQLKIFPTDRRRIIFKDFQSSKNLRYSQTTTLLNQTEFN
jgi:hypothetical protein